MAVVGLRFSSNPAGCSLRGQPSALREFAGRLRALRDRTEVRVRNGVIAVVLVDGEPLCVRLEDDVLSLRGGRSVLDELRETVELLAAQAESSKQGSMIAHAHYVNHGPDDDYDVAPGSLPLLITGDWPWGPGGAEAFGALAKETRWSGDLHDDASRHALVVTAVRRGLAGELVRSALAGEPRQTLPSLVNAVLEVVGDDEHAAWLALVPVDLRVECAQRSEELRLGRRANRGGLTVDEAAELIDTWSDKFQRRLSEQLLVPELLGLLAARGHTRRIRQTADLRRAQLLGRALSDRELAVLVTTLGARLGYCLSPLQVERLGAEAPHDVDGFTDAVLVAEGLDPLTHDSRLRAQVRRLVLASFDRERKLRAQWYGKPSD